MGDIHADVSAELIKSYRNMVSCLALGHSDVVIWGRNGGEKLIFWALLCNVTSCRWFDHRQWHGRVPEWSKGADCKSAARKPTVGSNPTAAFGSREPE